MRGLHTDAISSLTIYTPSIPYTGTPGKDDISGTGVPVDNHDIDNQLIQ